MRPKQWLSCLLIRYKAKAQKPTDLIAVWGLVETLTATQAETEAETLGDLLAYVNAEALVNNFGDVEAKALDQKLAYPQAVAKADTFGDTLVCVEPEA